MIENSEHTHLLIPFSSCDEPRKRLNGIAPMAYSGLWIKPDNTRIYLNGYGGEKSPSVMLAHGIAISIEAIMLHDPDASQIVCIMEQLKFWTAQEKILFQQLLAGKVTADGHGAYRKLTELRAIANLDPRAPANADEGALVAQSKDIAKEVAREALGDFMANPERYRIPGVYVSRGTLPARAA